MKQGCGSGSLKQFKRLIFGGSGSNLMKEVGSGSELGSERAEKLLKAEAFFLKSGAFGFYSNWL